LDITLLPKLCINEETERIEEVEGGEMMSSIRRRK
jgi:hypothetical protein